MNSILNRNVMKISAKRCNWDQMNSSSACQPSAIIPPAFDPHVDYESCFEENMRLLEGYHAVQLGQQQLQQVWDNVWYFLRCLKTKWQFYQRYASLALPASAVFPTNMPLPLWDSYHLRERFQRLYAYLARFPEATGAMQMLIQESMIIEWPNVFAPFDTEESNGDSKSMVDRAPLIFISRTKGKSRVRRRYPTVQLRILALNNNTAPVLVQCRARVVTQSASQLEMDQFGKWRPDGRLMNVKKDGEKKRIVHPYEEEDGALVSNCGSVGMSPLQYDNFGTLMVQFGEIGIDRAGKRAAHNLLRYHIEMYCRIRFSNGLEVNHTILSHPFLIAANRDQNTTVLGDLTWEILTNHPLNRTIPMHLRRVRWCDLKHVLRHSVQSQLIGTRTLDNEELFHLQCMLFLPLAVGHYDLNQLERYLFGNERDNIEKVGIKKIKYRLLREFVCDYIEIDEQHLLKNKCVSMKDCKTELQHSVWEWLSEAIEMIVDCDAARLVCEDCSARSTKIKKKKSLMLKLFNEKTVTMSSRERVWKVYKSLYRFDEQRNRLQTKAMLIHFCDEMAGHLTIHYSNTKSDEKPTFGNVSARDIKTYESGLAGMLMQEPWPSQFSRLVKFDSDKDALKKGKEGATFLMKKQVFVGFQPKQATVPVVPDPLQHDAALGPVDNAVSSMMSKFRLTFSNTVDAPQDPHQRQLAGTVSSDTNTFITVSVDSKDITHIDHSIGNGYEHLSLVTSTLDSRNMKL